MRSQQLRLHYVAGAFKCAHNSCACIMLRVRFNALTTAALALCCGCVLIHTHSPSRHNTSWVCYDAFTDCAITVTKSPQKCTTITTTPHAAHWLRCLPCGHFFRMYRLTGCGAGGAGGAAGAAEAASMVRWPRVLVCVPCFISHAIVPRPR